ncbi:hypothetical protein G6F68_017809 [Rhizopus microsporus]|nr:hypothetical protein G6F68_017809 [Rhizopus microsporus]
MFVIDCRIAAALCRVQADARAVVRTEAPGDIGGHLELAAAGNAGGDTGPRLVRRTLGHQVDDAADAAAARRRARQERRGAPQHFHAFEQFGGDVLAGQQAVQPVDSWKLPKPRATRTPESFCSTSPTLRACLSWISSLV